MNKPPSEMTDRELDEAILREVSGYACIKPEGRGWRIERIDCMESRYIESSPSTSISDAMQVMEKIDPRFNVYQIEDGWRVLVQCSPESIKVASNKSLPRAICEAAILAIRERAK